MGSPRIFNSWGERRSSEYFLLKRSFGTRTRREPAKKACKITTKNSNTQIFRLKTSFFCVFSSFCQLYRAFLISPWRLERLFRSHFCGRCRFVYFAGYYPAFSVHFPRHCMPAIVFVPFRRIIFAALLWLGHRRISPSPPVLHARALFLSRFARTITSPSRPSHRLLPRMAFGHIRCTAPPARSQCGCSPAARKDSSFPPTISRHQKAATSLPPLTFVHFPKSHSGFLACFLLCVTARSFFNLLL